MGTATDMKDLVSRVATTLDGFERAAPDVRSAWGEFSHRVKQEGTLSSKTKELICVALSVACRCDLCIATHVNRALELGATRDEIIEAAEVAVLMNGGPALAYMGYVLDACDQLGKG
jgi:AhpD family alkylhydroperoxidase